VENMEKLCPICGSELDLNGYCSKCDQTITVYKKAELTSKVLYNNGLELARVRDISGAIGLLQRSLKFDKSNIQARNLIGLLYFEIGETVLALRHWVISKNTKSTDNIAINYLEDIQDNESHLDRLNSAIKKFNQSLNYIKQDSVDLAVIHLKKVISLNPKFVKAYTLLALCYMKEKQDDKAIKVLKKVLLIDKSNYVARKYYDSLISEDTENLEDPVEKRESKPAFPIKMPFSMSGSLLQFLALIFGVAIGFALVMVLIMPKQIDAKDSIIQTLESDLAIETTKYQDKETEYNSEVTLNQAYESDNQTLKSNLETSENALNATTKVLLAFNLHNKGEDIAAGKELYGLDQELLIDPIILEIYESTAADIALSTYEIGFVKQRNSNWQEAIDNLEVAIVLMGDVDYVTNAYYYLGKSYYKTDKMDLAKKQFEFIVENYPDSYLVDDSEWYLGEIAKQ